jgi:hypothetical protein
MISDGKPGWEPMLPPGIAEIKTPFWIQSNEILTKIF